MKSRFAYPYICTWLSRENVFKCQRTVGNELIRRYGSIVKYCHSYTLAIVNFRGELFIPYWFESFGFCSSSCHMDFVDIHGYVWVD